MQTLLQIVTSFCERSGLAAPTTVMGSLDKKVVQIRALLEEVGQYLVSEFTFEGLKRDTTWSSLATQDQGTLTSILGVAEGAAFDHFIPETFWNRTLRRPVTGATTDQDWQMLQTLIPGGPFQRYRLIGGHLFINPAPTAGHTMAVSWICKNWIVGAANTYKFVADTDVPVFNDTLLTMGLRAVWMREKGLPYSDLFNDFQSRAENEAGRSNVGTRLYLDQAGSDLKPGIWVPVGNPIA